MKKFLTKAISFILVFISCFGLASCKEETAEIELPKTITLTETKKEPELKVYDVNTKEITTMELEEYVKGVLAGEMFNTWNIEALKAQAILARTYTLYFLKNKTSKYEGADISNDITEAQAYDSSKINDNIEHAVDETRGKVILVDGEPIQAWFHSNSGGITTKASTGLNFLGEEKYTKVIESPETAENSENFSWSETFSKSEVLSALREMGVSVSTIREFKIGETDESGRATTFKIGSSEFSTNTFRLKIGSTKMKSTLIDEIVVSTGSISISGKGYGHGVGLSQWGAKIMAEEGKTAEDIINHYFDNVEIKKYSIVNN